MVDVPDLLNVSEVSIRISGKWTKARAMFTEMNSLPVPSRNQAIDCGQRLLLCL